jgi:hypothetical protein
MPQRKFALVDEHGQVQGSILRSDSENVEGLIDQGTGLVMHEIDFNKNIDRADTLWYWNGTDWAERSVKPDECHEWINGAWVNNEELALQAIRSVRAQKLKASDWTQLPDSPLTPTEVEQWRLYRQELRDVPQNLPPQAKITDAAWPNTPEDV